MKVFGPAAQDHAQALRFTQRQIEDNETHDLNRIKQSLHIATDPSPLPEHLDIESLRQLASFTNFTYLHYSGNCCLLSACVHYNIENNASILRTENTSQPHIGLEGDVVDEVIFGKVLPSSYPLFSIDEVSAEVLRRYEVNGERSCIVSTCNYIIPLIGDCEHDFNAVVVLDSLNKPAVQYLDAWKTSNTTPDSKALEAHFPPSARFTLRSFGSV